MTSFKLYQISFNFTDYTSFQKESKVPGFRQQKHPSASCNLRHTQSLHIRYGRLLSSAIRLSKLLQVVGNLQKVLLHRPHCHCSNVNFVETINLESDENLLPT